MQRFLSDAGVRTAWLGDDSPASSSISSPSGNPIGIFEERKRCVVEAIKACGGARIEVTVPAGTENDDDVTVFLVQF